MAFPKDMKKEAIMGDNKEHTFIDMFNVLGLKMKF